MKTLLTLIATCLLFLGCDNKPKKDVIPPPPDPVPCVFDEEPNDSIREAVYVGTFEMSPQDLCGELEDVDTYWFGHQEPLLVNFDVVADGPFQMFIVIYDEGELVSIPFFSTTEGDLVILQWLVEPGIDGFYIMLAPLNDGVHYDIEYWRS